MTYSPGAVRLPDSSIFDRGAAEPVVIVGLDGSPTSWDAFAWAAGEAIRTPRVDRRLRRTHG
jgi:hypothetical protein